MITSENSDFLLRSTSFDSTRVVPEHFVFNGMGCHGKNLSPELEWKGAPEDTMSFAITVMDPDAKKPGGWRHWTVINIPKEVNHLMQGASGNNALPEGAIELKNDFNTRHYGGPCPPRGDRPHRYVFTLYALRVEHLNPSVDAIEETLEENCILKTSFYVNYAY
jgi:Raf kinase inhibitor-like YbhB/YbcL family protein